jgi:hypothetical protein
MSDIADSRWMPPSPHREAILHELGRGRAHIEERGHHLSPLFVYEDGGAMELALMRLVDGRLIAVADAKLPETSTKHVDVCGTVDELERLWAEQPELADEAPEQWLALISHALAMCARMKQRLDAYGAFSDRVAAIAGGLAALEGPDHSPAPEYAARIREHIAAGGEHVRGHVPEMCELAEAIRKIAGDSELVLYRYRDLAIELGALYEEVRGGREWRKKS